MPILRYLTEIRQLLTTKSKEIVKGEVPILRYSTEIREHLTNILKEIAKGDYNLCTFYVVHHEMSVWLKISS
jgi:hypothetical protein